MSFSISQTMYTATDYFVFRGTQFMAFSLPPSCFEIHKWAGASAWDEWGRRSSTFPVLNLPAAAVHSLRITVTLTTSANLSLSIYNQSPIQFSCPATAFNYCIPTLWFPSSSA